uniref:Pentatricopeptide repeat-containing protein n=1 Tax=Ananas comosus var. bracteatus TaxID=296719 RepID=A0A6V7QYF5_ANACO
MNKLVPQAMYYFHNVDLRNSGISKHFISSLSKIKYGPVDDSYWLGRLDHKDWLAPNEVLKIFTNIRHPDLLTGAFEKVTTRMDYKPSEALYSLIIDKLAYARRFNEVEDLLKRAKNENCRLSDEFFYRLIKMYGNVANHPEKAIETLRNMPSFHCWPSVKTFNYVLNMLVCTRQYEIVHEIYMSASKLGITVDTCCFNILIKGLCQHNRLDAAFALLHELPKQGLEPNATTYSTLMHSLCKNGRLDEAFEVYKRMENEGIDLDTVTFNVLISGLCRQGRVDEGLNLLKEMKLKGCYPNSGTYEALLCGFLGKKQFVKAKDFMEFMISQGSKPSFSSYKLIIEGLCSEDSLDDAYSVLKQMVEHGFVPRMGTWKKILTCMF